MNRPDVLRDIANAIGMLADLGGITYMIHLAPKLSSCWILVKGPRGLGTTVPVFPVVGLASRIDTSRSYLLYEESLLP